MVTRFAHIQHWLLIHSARVEHSTIHEYKYLVPLRIETVRIEIVIATMTQMAVTHVTVESARFRLGVEADASVEEIERAFRRVARIWHPDKYQENKDVATLAFKNTCTAKDLLIRMMGQNPHTPQIHQETNEQMDHRFQ